MSIVTKDIAGIKKERIYRLDFKSTMVDRRPYYRSFSSQSIEWVQKAKQEELLKKKMQDENNALMARLESLESQVQFNNKLLQEMMKWMNFQLPGFNHR